MKRKYKIFLSSSFVDLTEHRISLVLKTLTLGHIPSGMEFFHAGEPRNLEVIREEIASSDIFVILVGARLGTNIAGKHSITYIMKEFKIAMAYNLPVIVFLLNENEYAKTRLKIPSNRRKEVEQHRRLDKFRHDVQLRKAGGGLRIAGSFSYSNKDDLCNKYADAIHSAVERFADKTGGWVKGNLYDDLNERIALGTSVSNPFFKQYAKRLNTFDTLAKRTLMEGASKEAIAEYFWAQYMPRLDKNKISNIYFESGSSIAYVSTKFIEYVKIEKWFGKHKLDTKLKLKTNNLFTYMDFLLVDEPQWSPMDIRLLPNGYVSNDYGATYGELKSARKMPSPNRPIPKYKLAEDAAFEVAKFTKRLAPSFTKENGIVLMTASGIDIDPNSPFPGPHVGSYYNMLVKRSLLSLKCPKILFLDQIKWDYKFSFGFCHPICDTGFTWNYVKKNTPIAIALAAKDQLTLDKLSASLAKNGFKEQERGNAKPLGEGPLPLIAANELFAKQFKL